MNSERQFLTSPFTYGLIALLLLRGSLVYPCTKLFRELIAHIHRPAFEWSAQLPEKGMSFESARAKGYLYLERIARHPLPRMDRAQRDAAIRTVDAFFDEAIKGYPDSTQQRLQSLYYDGVGQAYTPELFVQSGMLANWHLSQGKNGQAQFTVEFDSALQPAKLIKRILLIHECAVHVGQMDQRLIQVGANQLMREHDSKDPYLFTEMSAALAEKTLLSAIDFFAVEADASNLTDPVVRLGLLGHLYLANQVKLKNYVELHHRIESIPPSAGQVLEFLKHPH